MIDCILQAFGFRRALYRYAIKEYYTDIPVYMNRLGVPCGPITSSLWKSRWVRKQVRVLVHPGNNKNAWFRHNGTIFLVRDFPREVEGVTEEVVYL